MDLEMRVKSLFLLSTKHFVLLSLRANVFIVIGGEALALLNIKSSNIVAIKKDQQIKREHCFCKLLIYNNTFSYKYFNYLNKIGEKKSNRSFYKNAITNKHNVCPRSSYPIYILS